MDTRVLIFGLGYSGAAVAQAARARGWAVRWTSREAKPGAVPFDAADEAIREATHIVSSAPPQGASDPVLARYAGEIAGSKDLRWAGYMSTTGVYGDRGGGWVDEDTPPAPTGPRGARRIAAEAEWSRLPCAVDLFRIAGIYGPGRSAFDDLRAGTARRIAKPGHQFGRIHRDDIAAAVVAAMAQDRPPGVRVLNLSDDEPAEASRVTAEAARLLGIEPPPEIPFEQAVASMSEMGRSFWAENRKVASRKTQAALGIAWRHPTFREGLAAILAEEAAHRPAQQRKV
jgi:nucleoside-diphosphate-sugar epimerase